MKPSAGPKVQHFKTFQAPLQQINQHPPKAYFSYLHTLTFICITQSSLQTSIVTQPSCLCSFYGGKRSLFWLVHASPFNVHSYPKRYSHSSVCQGILPRTSVSLYLQTKSRNCTYDMRFTCRLNTETRSKKTSGL